MSCRLRYAIHSITGHEGAEQENVSGASGRKHPTIIPQRRHRAAIMCVHPQYTYINSVPRNTNNAGSFSSRFPEDASTNTSARKARLSVPRRGKQGLPKEQEHDTRQTEEHVD